MTEIMEVFLEYLVSNPELKVNYEITKKIVDIQKLDPEERSYLFFVLDNVLQNIRTKVDFAE